MCVCTCPSVCACACMWNYVNDEHSPHIPIVVSKNMLRVCVCVWVCFRCGSVVVVFGVGSRWVDFVVAVLVRVAVTLQKYIYICIYLVCIYCTYRI